MDAAARHDYGWFDSARRKLFLGVMSYVVVAAVMLTIFGSWLIDRWLGGKRPHPADRAGRLLLFLHRHGLGSL